MQCSACGEQTDSYGICHNCSRQHTWHESDEDAQDAAASRAALAEPGKRMTIAELREEIEAGMEELEWHELGRRARLSREAEEDAMPD